MSLFIIIFIGTKLLSKTKNKKLDFEANFDSNRINMKGLLHHTPTNDDISNILKEFTVDFLLKGYGCLVKDLHAQLLSDMNKVQIDTSHFFWLITYFLKFAAQLELELEHLTFVLSYEVISYLTFEGVNLCEELEIASLQQGSDLSSCLRRMHLVVTAIREFLQALDTYQKITHLNEKDKNYLKFLQYQIGATEDLKSLFNLLLKRYNPSFQSKQYLQDLIVTNHILLLHLDGVVKLHEYKGITMVDHLKQFATVEIMHQYGFLLVDFQENGEFVNDCIFNMMHHVGGDLGQISTLFQPVILKTFSKIWEIEYQLCDDWSDLIEYVINKFINKTQQRPMFNIADEPRSPCKIQIEPNPWTKQQMDCLYWYYVQGKRSKDVIGQIMKQLNDNGQGHKTRIAVIQRLLQQDIVSLLEYDKLMKAEDPSFDRLVKSPTPSISTVESGINMKHSLLLSDNNKPIDDIQFLRDRLLKENKGNLINWIQRVLVECVYVKLNINNNNNNSNNNNNNYNINNKHSSENLNIMEPVAHHFIIKKQSIPIVPWNAEQSNILVYQPFILLLHKLGFHLPADTGKLFVRIPDFWTADILYSVALKLGPIDKSILKFDENQFLQCKERVLAAPNNINISNVPLVTTDYLSNSKSKTSNSIIRFTPDPALPPSVPNWLNVVMKSRKIQVKSLQQLLPTNPTNTMNLIQPTLISNSEEHETLSNCETASVASDLIRMYVSDEETN